jgi:ribosomal protein S18 acetylase RimI-like enzyme
VLPGLGFHCVEENLRQSFRILAKGRPHGDVIELPGVSIASLGVAFQMFNAAFLSEPVEFQAELEERLRIARRHFDSRAIRWAFWICEDWIAPALRQKLSRTCEAFGLRLSTEMPGMTADVILPPERILPEIKTRRVESAEILKDFRAIGSTCFRVPTAWFSEVFDENLADRQAFVCWVGYRKDLPVTTAACVAAKGTIGIYNVATVPEYRERGYGEAITRHAIEAGRRENAGARPVLQSTSKGLGIYARMGFRVVTRVLVYNSIG